MDREYRLSLSVLRAGKDQACVALLAEKQSRFGEFRYIALGDRCGGAQPAK